MNGLTLRITGGGSKKTKTSIGFAPVVANSCDNDSSTNNEIFEEFNRSSSCDGQLTLLKKVFDEEDLAPREDIIKFLVTVFFQAELKHPVKCFITRQVTKRNHLHNMFAKILAQKIRKCIQSEHNDYKTYIDIVTKVSACIENFPAGSSAVKEADIPLAAYFKNCLKCCVETLRENSTLSPTEKNEIFNLAHLAARLLLYIVQKSDTNNVDKLKQLFNSVRKYIRDLLYDEDVPMDTKSVCGILYLSMHMFEHGPDAWVDIVQPERPDGDFVDLLKNEAAQLSLYSAVITVVSIDKLQKQMIQNSPSCLVFTKLLLDIGERSSSESVFILGVTRTLLQICKTLDKVTDKAVGLQMVDSMLVFIWSHLEHYMDSVRHLTAQMLSCVVRYCSYLKKQGDDKALDELLSALVSLDQSRKSYYLSIAALTSELGALALLARLRLLITQLLQALNLQAVQASATTALEVLLQRHIKESSPQDIHAQWIQPIVVHVTNNTLDSTVLNILEGLLVKAVKWDENLMGFILSYIKQTDVCTKTEELKCVLMLLSVVRKSGAANILTNDDPHKWKGLIAYDVLKMAAVDAVDETRILSLSLVVECPKSTEALSAGDLQLVRHFLTYNMNAQAPNFRQLTLSILNKFVKRLEESSKVLLRTAQSQFHVYTQFIEELRALCFSSLVPGANYTRRCVALQLLARIEHANILYDRTWKREYVDKLLLHLEDSYENNKALALEILDKCPTELFEENTYKISIKFEDILQQASSLKPTACTSAAYKFDFLRRKLPHHILRDTTCTAAEPVLYTLVDRLHTRLLRELEICENNMVVGARDAPMYGLLHCIRHLMQYCNAEAIREDEQWTVLVDGLLRTGMRASACVGCVVNNSSPEGHLPMDTGLALTDHGNTGGVSLSDGRPVTAQMVLLCAWRSVKEVSLLLGTIASRLSICGEGHSAGTVNATQLAAVGQHFTALLAHTKHRGAFEQAYVGFTQLLHRLWRCRSASLHGLPRGWAEQLLQQLTRGGTQLCATRRSAGLPFMIQALVTSEVQALGSSRWLDECVRALVQRCGSDGGSGGDDGAAVCANVLRALVRESALHAHAAAHVQDALLAALHGYTKHSWTRRNSSTLLFSALMVRTFGVTRTRDHEALCVRNKMTGRIFFLRYPKLYDYMLEQLQEVSRSDNEQRIHPSLYPILLLLARLYPSSLEGTVSNLKLVAFIPHVLCCAKSSVLKSRQLAAKAMVPLISPEQYFPHLESMFNLLNDKSIKRNFCHGILLQLIRLLDATPDVAIDKEMLDKLTHSFAGTVWVMEQAVGDVPCYVITDEYVKVINLIMWRLPTVLHEDTINSILKLLPTLIFNDNIPKITTGRDLCLANALYLYIIILTKLSRTDDICNLIYSALQHKSYEVVLSTLNYLLILHKDFDPENKFQEHLCAIRDENVLKELKTDDKYIKILCEVLKNAKYMECKQKCLKVLTIEGETQRAIIDIDNVNEEVTIDTIVRKLFDAINDSHENLTHIYLESLSKFVTKNIIHISLDLMVDVLSLIFACSTPDNKDENRSVVVGFLENNAPRLIKLELAGLNKEKQFEYTATIMAILTTTLEDDSEALRLRTARVILSILQVHSHLVPSRCGEMLRDHIQLYEDNVALFVLLALLDFRSEVCLTDEINDECRVFDQNERYNIFLEETVWTSECAKKIINICKDNDSKLIDTVLSTIDNPVYANTFNKLCNNNIILFKKMVAGNNEHKSEVINPKIQLFIDMLS